MFFFFFKNLTSFFYLILPVIMGLGTVRRNNKQSIRQSRGLNHEISRWQESEVRLSYNSATTRSKVVHCIFRIGSISKNLILCQDIPGGSLHQSCLAHIVSFNLLPFQIIPSGCTVSLNMSSSGISFPSTVPSCRCSNQ